jgi:hypothetical protein
LMTFFLTTLCLCVFVVLLVVDVDDVVALLAAGVLDPPDPHPAVRTAMAIEVIRIRFIGVPP